MSDIFGGEDVEGLEQQAREADAAPVEETVEAAPEEAVGDVVEEREKPMVSIDALHQARREAQEAKARAQALEQKVQGFDEMRQQLDEWRKQQQQRTQEQEFDADPLGAIRREIQDLKQSQSKAQQTTQQQTEQMQRAQELERTVASQVQQYTAQQPDYPDALNHLMRVRAEELQIWGAGEAEIPRLLEAEAQQIAESAVQSGRNPAELVYQMAKLRGYAPAPKEAKPKATVERIDRGQKAAQSLSNTQGEAEGVGLTDIAKMSDAEFDAYWEKMAADANPRH